MGNLRRSAEACNGCDRPNPASAATPLRRRTAAEGRNKYEFSPWGPVTKKPLGTHSEPSRGEWSENAASIPPRTQFDDEDSTALTVCARIRLRNIEKKGAPPHDSPVLS